MRLCFVFLFAFSPRACALFPSLGESLELNSVCCGDGFMTHQPSNTLQRTVHTNTSTVHVKEVLLDKKIK